MCLALGSTWQYSSYALVLFGVHFETLHVALAKYMYQCCCFWNIFYLQNLSNNYIYNRTSTTL